MGKIIAFANQKGGVGKTTTCVNTAAYIASMGKKVLLIDLDPQGNATSGVGIEKSPTTKTIYNVIDGDAIIDEVIVKTIVENLDFVPATVDLAGAEIDLVQMPNRENIIKNRLARVKDKYDYIFIDCPPSLGLLTVNALTSCNSIIIPIQCEFYALEGLSQLTVTINRIKANFNSNLNITGILITMYNSRLLLSLQVMNEMKKHYSDKLFRTQISRGVKVSEAPGFGMPVYYHDKRSKGANEYLDVASELASRI